MLRLFRRRFRTLDGNVVERRTHQLLVRYIGTGHGHGQRYAAAIDQRRAFDAELATIGRVFPGFFPHPAATWSSPRPCSAISNRCLSTHRTRSKRVARAPRTHPTAPTLESTHGSRCRSRTASASPSTGSLWTRRTTRHPRRSAWADVGGRLYNWDCKLGSRDRSDPTKPRGSGETLMPNRWPSTTSVRFGAAFPHQKRTKRAVEGSIRIGS
jgi:hypothetical protein